MFERQALSAKNLFTWHLHLGVDGSKHAYSEEETNKDFDVHDGDRPKENLPFSISHSDFYGMLGPMPFIVFVSENE